LALLLQPFFHGIAIIMAAWASIQDLRNSTMSLHGVDVTDSTLGELANSVPAQHSGSIRELGRYRSFLRLKAMGMVSRFQSKLEPSDVVQQTLLDAHRNLDQFRGTSDAEMAKWLGQMLTNNVADAARALTRQKRDVRREQPLQVDGDSFPVGADQWVAAEQTTPSLCVARCEQVQRLQEAIQQLPLPQREVIVLHHLQGRSLNETAELIGRSPAAVAGLLFRGLKSLRSLLAG
jgi:RNA polymerase sigma-70 factor (ECF subfamily)